MKRKIDTSVRHVMPALKGGWIVKAAGAAGSAKTFRTKEAAVKQGRHLARREHGTLYIHKLDGTISEKQIFDEAKVSAHA